MEVGPSAAPIIPMEAASFKSKPISAAAQMAKKIPNCAAAPKRNIMGWERSGPKSIMAPIPMNNRIGSASEASIPTSNSHSMIPFTSPIPVIV